MANSEGYPDPTAEKAMRNYEKRKTLARKTIVTLQNVAHLAGFDIVGKIRLREHDTGREWK